MTSGRRQVLAVFLVGVASSLIVTAVVEVVRERREAARARFPEPPAPGWAVV